MNMFLFDFFRKYATSVLLIVIGFTSGFFIACLSFESVVKSSFSIISLQRNLSVKHADLFSTIRILCWVVTNPNNHETKARKVKETWGKRCNKLLFMSSVEDPVLPSISLPVKEGRDHLWAKTKAAVHYIYNHHLDDADWFFKSDDDTYAIMENMRLFLSNFNKDEALYLGCRFKPFSPEGYMSGGAGYIFSRKTLQIFNDKVLSNKSNCRRDHNGYEDVETALCLANSGVKLVDTRDDSGSMLFLPYLPDVFSFPNRLNGSDTKWFLKYIKTPVKTVRILKRSRTKSYVEFHHDIVSVSI